MKTYKLNESKFKKFLKSDGLLINAIIAIAAFVIMTPLLIIAMHIRDERNKNILNNFNSQFEIMITDKELSDYNLEKLKTYKSGYFKERQLFNEELFLKYIQQIDFDFWYEIKDILKGG